MGEHDRNSRLEEVFAQVAARPPEEWGSYLDRACGGDRQLVSEVESLLRAEEEAGAFLEAPALPPGLRSPPRGGAPGEGGRIGPYRVLSRLGEGGTSTVLLAVRDDDQLRRRVAIKLLCPGMASRDHLQRFAAERQILAGLAHPNIARLYDAGTTEDGLPYFVMEYVEGEPLVAYCDRHRLSDDERLELFRTICGAVHYAHQNLVVHRDLKPGNILVTADGTPKLVDFGIAKLLNPELAAPAPQPTLAWQRLLTPEYASPEQVQGKAITTASDIYSLGVVLYQLLAGTLPFRLHGKSLREVEEILTQEKPAPPSRALERHGCGGPDGTDRVGRGRGARLRQLRRRLEGDLDTIVLTALRREPRRRYASAEALSEDLRRHLAGLPVLARGDTLTYRAGKFLKRHRWGVAATAAVLLLLIGFGVVVSVQAARLARERDEAVQERAKSARMVELIEEVFRSIDPEHLRGRSLTTEEMLRWSTARARSLDDQPEVQAALMTVLANLYQTYGRLDEAEALHREALEIRLHRPGESTETAASLFGLATALHAQGDYERAGELYARVLKLRRELLGPQRPEVASVLSAQAVLAFDRGDLSVAERLHHQALAMWRRIYGDEHPEVAQSLNDLATLLFQSGRLEEAERLHREALRQRQELLGSDHPEVAESLNNLGVVLWETGNTEEALRLYQEALALQRVVWGDEHPEVARTLNNVAAALYRLDDLPAAEEAYRESLRLRRQLLGPEHPLVAVTLNNLAALLRKRGDLAIAEEHYREALAIWDAATGDRDPRAVYSLLGLALTLQARGRHEAAESLLRRAIAIRSQAFGRNHLTAYAKTILGECLTAQGRFEEAERLLAAALPVLLTERGEDHPETVRARQRLAGLYRAWGRPLRAAAWEARRDPDL